MTIKNIKQADQVPSSKNSPLYISKVEAGFLSPTEDYKETNLDLNIHLIKNPPATFFVRVSGDSMVNAGIYDGSLLIVDRSLPVLSGKIIIAVVNGELTVKRFKKEKDQVRLLPENKNYAPIVVTKEMEFSTWGVVTSVINQV